MSADELPEDWVIAFSPGKNEYSLTIFLSILRHIVQNNSTFTWDMSNELNPVGHIT